jgi:hypothetical protein
MAAIPNDNDNLMLTNYWHNIQRAAKEEKKRRTVRSVATTAAVAGAGAAVGTAVVPVLGTIVGGMLGVIGSIFTSMAVSDTRKKLVFSHILVMDDQTGLTYARFLYGRYDRALTVDELVAYIMPLQWDEHVQ